MKNIYLIIAKMAVVMLSFILLQPGNYAYAASSDDYATSQIAVMAPSKPRKDSAYIIFEAQPQMSGMTYYEPGSAGRYDELYSEAVEWNGVPGRQVYVENYLYLKLDEDFADEKDSVFEVTLDYWDYGGGGYFYVEYIPRGESEIKTERVYKLGLDENNVKTAGTWFSVTMYLDDVCFTGSMENGADIRIRSGAYNTFSKVEIRNLSRNATPEDKFGVFNTAKAQTLHSLNAFDGFNDKEAFATSLEKELTREEALVQLIKSYKMEEEAISKNLTTSFQDVSAEAAPYVAMAQELDILDRGDTLGANEKFPQKELVTWYLKLLGVEIGDRDVYKLAREYNLITPGSMIFQENKNADADALVALAMNVFAIPNVKTGYNPFTDGFKNGEYTLDTIANTDEEMLWNWLMSDSFKLPKKTHVDPYTNRTYHTVDFFGQRTIKPYFTQNCMSMDETRLYFRTLDNKFWEYNIETEMCRYMGELPTENNTMVTPLNNLWYINKDFEIRKINLDTYEETLVGRLPEWQKAAPSLLQVNNDETKLSVWWRDTKGDFDNTKMTRLPIFDITTGEWDLSHYYGFSYPDYAPNHPAINPNPDYSNYYFFAHETSSATNEYFFMGSGMPDRVWMLNTDTGEYYPAFDQKWFRSPDPDVPGSGYGGESLGHEVWSPDGEWLHAVRHPQAAGGVLSSIAPTNAYFVMQRPDGTDKRYVAADFSEAARLIGVSSTKSNHSMLSFDSRWIVSDTEYGNRKWSGLYIFDAQTGASNLMALLRENGSAHPGHTHPQFSPKGTYAIFSCYNDDYTVQQLGWMDVSDITLNPAPGGRYNLSESCEALDYEGEFVFDVEPLYNEEGEYTSTNIPAGKELYVDVKKEVAYTDNTSATITITYKDTTTLPIKLVYNKWNVTSPKYQNCISEHVLYIERNNTGKVLTKTFKIKDINLENMGLFGTDFKIGAIGTDAEILSVEITVS